MIPKEYLQLSLAQILSLHDPQRRPGPVTLSRLFKALRRMNAQLRADEASAAREQREWLAQQFDSISPR